MQRALTPRQTEILELIREHIADQGYPPTRADIARTLGFRSPNAAEEQKRAASGMTFGVSSGRKSRLLGLEKVKDYDQFGFG